MDGRPGAATESSCRSPIMDLMEDEQVPGGYVGESTRREIAYAESLGKPVRYLSRERLARTGDGTQE